MAKTETQMGDGQNVDVEQIARKIFRRAFVSLRENSLDPNLFLIRVRGSVGISDLNNLGKYGLRLITVHPWDDRQISIGVDVVGDEK